MNLPVSLKSQSFFKLQNQLYAYTNAGFYIYAVTLAALFSVVGILWDISWHTSIGRDQFLTPPHILIYLGAILGGLFSAIQVLVNTFRSSTKHNKGAYIKFWGIFYASLGSLFCIWGAIAMLTSAPFDNWWHNAYGLDVKILSPPHVLLLMGMFFLEFGSCVSISKNLNTAGNDKKSVAVLQVLFIIAASSLLCLIYTISNPVIRIRNMRTGFFYEAAAAITLIILPALSRPLRLKWGMSLIAFGYFLLAAIINWVLQIFPAEPKLGPVLTHITHFQPAMFPLLIFFPAIFMDMVMMNKTSNNWTKSFLISAIFVLGLVAIEYPLSGFLLQSPASRNWFFGGNTWYFGNPPDLPFRYKFSAEDIQPLSSFVVHLAIAILAGTLISRLGLRWGKWMQNIQR